jgi:hypothetical protein
MNEDFVSFSLAKKLKEKNFIGNIEIGLQCGFYYKDGEDIDVFYDGCDNADVAADEYLRPTIAQVLKWLREEKKIHIGISPQWQYTVYDMRCNPWIGRSDMQNYDDYTKAAIAGIEYCLDNLI